MIRRAVLQRPDELVGGTVHLWDRLASELISIIGENGFASLFARSVHVTRNRYPWIDSANPLQKSDARFSSLQLSLEGRDFTEASEASILLLTTLVDIITLLIGELLMTRILCSAWGNTTLETAGKEQQQ
ncbi:hypothetical protein GCM10022212_10650 [Actimicrobium antarcticum]|uniref:Uncharacterized protein n=2 Tax=Actimicrobium antarcticum TaxID=1051899 RepID=A0ABP7SVK0_9BURK